MYITVRNSTSTPPMITQSHASHQIHPPSLRSGTWLGSTGVWAHTVVAVATARSSAPARTPTVRRTVRIVADPLIRPAGAPTAADRAGGGIRTPDLPLT